MAELPEITSAALTRHTWADFEKVMGANGGARGCWCMHWRMSFAEWEKGKGAGNRSQMRRRARTDPPPGLVCYLDGEPVGWVAVGERSEYPRMRRSAVTRPVDDVPAWVISCLYVSAPHRRSGLQTPMINAACDFAAEHGAPAVDAYPVEPQKGKAAGADNAMTGIASAFRAAGFTELARPKPDRRAMRRELT
ncbi:GNAT family N-acetyltransferase [Spirillospora sp. CA-294931]|uniref:GNAT family N-acetyltransferase n=1 Tax=Spirillospora sp. CA-294931 TaxID=3240042 RepID=UPI003D90AE67